jgi:hypothetical protein
VFGAAILLPSHGAAKTFRTDFKFEVHFSDGVRTYNDNQTIAVDVWLPPDQGWQCIRDPVAFADGRMRGSFACSNDGWKTDVLTMVGCKATEVDHLRVAAMRVFAPRPDGRPQGAATDAGTDATAGAPFGKYVDLSVSCETVAQP